MAATKEDVVSFIDNMTVLEMSEFVKELEDKYGVTAAAPAAAAAAPAAAAPATAEPEGAAAGSAAPANSTDSGPAAAAPAPAPQAAQPTPPAPPETLELDVPAAPAPAPVETPAASPAPFNPPRPAAVFSDEGPDEDELVLGAESAETPAAPAPAPAQPAPRVASGGTLFERMAGLTRGSEKAPGSEEGTPGVDIPRFLNRQNNQ